MTIQQYKSLSTDDQRKLFESYKTASSKFLGIEVTTDFEKIDQDPSFVGYLLTK
jgi:hypothetical protein